MVMSLAQFESCVTTARMHKDDERRQKTKSSLRKIVRHEKHRQDDNDKWIETTARRLAAALRAAAGEGSYQPVVLLPAAR